MVGSFDGAVPGTSISVQKDRHSEQLLSCYITFNEAAVLRVWLHSGDVLRTEEEEEDENWPDIPPCVTFCSSLWQMCANQQRHSNHTLLSHMPKKNSPQISKHVKPTDAFSSSAPFTVLLLLYLLPFPRSQLSPTLWVLTDFLFGWD